MQIRLAGIEIGVARLHCQALSVAWGADVNDQGWNRLEPGASVSYPLV